MCLQPAVLVVEDEILIQSVVEEALQEAGYAVQISRSGEEAVAVIEVPNAQLKAIVTDINLRGSLEGWDVARRAREINPAVAIVFMTGRGGADWPSKGVPNSILVSKPFAPAQIVAAVSQLLNTGET